MANKRLNIRGGLNIKASLSDGSGDPVLTRDDTTTEVGKIPPVDTSSYISNSLPDSQILIGNASNIATPRSVSGVVNIQNTGEVSFNNGVIFDQHVANLAGIQYSKLTLTNGIINSDINSAAAIARTKFASGTPYRVVVNNASGVMSDNAAITPSMVIISDANGLPTASSTTSTVLGYLDISSSLTMLLANKLNFSGAIGPAEGDLIQYIGGEWINLGIGSSGTVLTSDGFTASWQNGISNGIPPGGTTDQYLRKIDGTDYNTTWETLNVSRITDLTATAAEINILDGATVTSTQINYLLGASGNIQTQLNTKLSNSLSYGAIYVGDAGGVAVQLAPGISGYVLKMVGVSPQWQPETPPGNVSGVAPSTDNALVRWNGIGADSIQNSAIIVDDSNNVTGVASLSSGQIDILNQAALRLHETGSTNYVAIRASGVMPADYTITLPAAAPASNTYLKYDGTDYVWDVAGGGGAVSSVSGTTNRITVSPTTGATVVDIAATYVGQASITTLGTIGTGVWNGTSISTTYTDAKIISVTGTTNRITISGTATDPVFNISTLYAGQVTITTLGTVTTGTWHATVIEAIYGGTGQNAVTTGDLLYGSATNTWSRLAGVATGNVLISGGVATAPSWGKVTASHVDPTTIWLVGGNSLVGAGNIGSTSAQDVNVISNNVTRATFASNGRVTIGSAYTSANSTDYAIVLNSTVTGHATASGEVYNAQFNGSVSAGANSQTLISYLFKPTFTTNGFLSITSEVIRAQSSGGTNLFQLFDSGSIRASTSAAGDDVFLFLAGGAGLLRLNNSSSISFGNSSNIKLGRINDLGVFTAAGGAMGAVSTVSSTNLNYALYSTVSWNGASNNARHLGLRYTWNPTSGSNTVTSLSLDPTINQTGTASGAIYGIDYNPTITSVNGAAHYGLLVRPTGALNGFGTGAPTATMHVVGNTILDSNVKIGSATDYIEIDRGASWIRRVSPTVATLTILGDVNTAGDGGSIFIQSGSSSTNQGGEIRLIPGAGATGFGRLLLGFNNIAIGESTDTTIPVDLLSSPGNATTLNGQDVILEANAAYSISGNGNGGNVTVQSGQRRVSGSGVDGDVILNPRTGYVDFKITPVADAAVPNTHLIRFKVNGAFYDFLAIQV